MAFIVAMGMMTAFAIRHQPAGRGVDCTTVARAVAGATGLPLGLFAVAMLYVLVMRRAAQERATSAIGAERIAQA